MSRAKKERVRRRRREQAGRSVPVQRLERKSPAGQDLILLSYEVTTEKLTIREAGEPPPEVVKRLRGRIEELYALVHDDPARAVPPIKALIQEHPDWAMLYNWLESAYSRLGDMDNAEALAIEAYRRNPRYLFAKVNCAQVLLRRGDLDAVAEVFDHKFDLKLLYPHRNVFHISEFVAFASVMVELLMRRGEPEVAKKMFKVLKDLAPDHEATGRLAEIIEGSLLVQLARRLSRLALRRGHPPR